MFGVLVVEAGGGELGYLRAFSGTIDGRFELPGFVAPIFDRQARSAIETAGERIVSRLTDRARDFASSEDLANARAASLAMASQQAAQLRALREQHADGRQARRAQRARLAAQQLPPGSGAEQDLLDLAQQSRRDKTQRRLLDETHAEARRGVEAELARLERRLASHERLHRIVSRRLMQQIHDTYRVANSLGEVRPLRDLYAPAQPPGGAGDCAAPKLLAHAYAHGLVPIALAEFWWGAPPPGGGRVSGSFYPACRDKCGPLLSFMLEGLDATAPRRFVAPDPALLDLRVLYEDEWIIVVDKPCGLLSVPSRSGVPDDSVLARLRRHYDGVLLVHRLDLDTSGLLVAARDSETHAALQRQFLKRTVEKRYIAIVERDVAGDEGRIDLALRVDVHDRPRQIHDPEHGRPAVTEWRAEGRRVTFFPRTGRTHQLRVHAAHPLGLGAPIVGDRLYGHAGHRLMLHAESLAFVHPKTGARVVFESLAPF